MEKKREPRQPGYYWVKIGDPSEVNEWRIAEYCNFVGGWEFAFPGDMNCYREDELIEIDERPITREQ